MCVRVCSHACVCLFVGRCVCVCVRMHVCVYTSTCGLSHTYFAYNVTADMSGPPNSTTSPLDGASQTDLNGEDSNILNIHMYMFFIRPIISR